VKVSADGINHRSRDELHRYWDTQFVERLGTPPSALAAKMLAQITDVQVATWQQGTPDDWAMIVDAPWWYASISVRSFVMCSWLSS
jgi:hypothetical protein